MKSGSGATTLEASFALNGIRHDFGFSYDDEKIIDEWLFSYPEGRRRRLYERDCNGVQFGSSMRGAKKTIADFTRPNVLFLSTATQNEYSDLGVVAQFFRRVFSSNKIAIETALLDATFGRREIDERTIKFLEAVGTGVIAYKQTEADVPKAVKELMIGFTDVLRKQKVVDDDVEIPDLDEKKYRIELGHRNASGEETFFGGEQESAGTRRLLILMNSIFKVLDRGDIAIIDELDASLHALAVQAIIKLFTDPSFNKNGAQLIATTHDTNLLDPDQLRRDEIWFVEKSYHGSSEYFSLAEVASRKGESFEKSYLQGRYGAVPPAFDRAAFDSATPIQKL